MSSSIQKASDFQLSTVTFSKRRANKHGGGTVYINSNSEKIYLQFPYMRAPFGLSAFTDDRGNTSHSLDLSFDNNDPVCIEIQQKIESLDNLVLQTVVDNSQEWLGKQYKVETIRDADLYRSIIRKPKNPEYPSTMKLKIMKDSKGEFIPEIYNHKKEIVQMDVIEKKQYIMTIVELGSIWFVGNKFGVTLKLSQALLKPSTKLPSFAFVGVETGSHNMDEEEEEEDEEHQIDI